MRWMALKSVLLTDPELLSCKEENKVFDLNWHQARSVYKFFYNLVLDVLSANIAKHVVFVS